MLHDISEFGLNGDLLSSFGAACIGRVPHGKKTSPVSEAGMRKAWKGKGNPRGKNPAAGRIFPVKAGSRGCSAYRASRTESMASSSVSLGRAPRAILGWPSMGMKSKVGIDWMPKAAASSRSSSVLIL